jgi:DNA/RNA-binding domain of Phe-tRNA-synthetase-like protein
VKFRVHPRIFEVFPGLHIGVVKASGIDNRGDSAAIQASIRKIQGEIRQNIDPEALAGYPKIQNWRNAYTCFGAKPKKHRSSVESLYRMTLDGTDFRPINRIVDIYNYVSLCHMVPVGGDDLAKVQGDIHLRFARGDEPFFPLGCSEMQRARKGEVVYADEREVLCRRWNWRESENTKMTDRTRNVLLVSEGLPPVTAEEIEGIVLDLRKLIKNHCGGEIDVGILSVAKSDWDI